MRPALSPVYSLHKVPTAKQVDNTILYEYEVKYIPAEVVQAESHCLRLADDIYDDYFYKPTVARKMAWRHKNRRTTETVPSQRQTQDTMMKNLNVNLPPDAQAERAQQRGSSNGARRTTIDVVSFPKTVMQPASHQAFQQPGGRPPSEEANRLIDGISFQYVNPSNRTKFQQEMLEDMYYQRARSSSLSSLGEARRVLAQAQAKKKQGKPPGNGPERAVTNPGRSESVSGQTGAIEIGRLQSKSIELHNLNMSNSFTASKKLQVKSGRVVRKGPKKNGVYASHADPPGPLLAIGRNPLEHGDTTAAVAAPLAAPPAEKVALSHCRVFGASALVLSRSQSYGTKSLSNTTLTGIPLSAEIASAYTPLYIGSSNGRSSSIIVSRGLVNNVSCEPLRSSALILHNSRISRDSLSSANTTARTLDPRPSLTTSNLSKDYPNLKDKLVENILQSIRASVLTVNDLDSSSGLLTGGSGGLKPSVASRLLAPKEEYKLSDDQAARKLSIPADGVVKRTRRVPKLQSTPTVNNPPQRALAESGPLDVQDLAPTNTLNISQPPVNEEQQQQQQQQHQDAFHCNNISSDLFITQYHSFHGDGSDEAVYIELGASTPPNLSEL